MAFVYVIKQLLPIGGSGIMYGVLIFSVVTAVLSGINGVSTIFTFDIYRKLVKKDVSQTHLIKVGRYFAACALTVGALYTPIVGSFKHIFDFFQECWAFVAIPISLTFLFGVINARMTSNLAFYLLLSTFPMFLMPYVVKILDISMNIFNVAGIVWIVMCLFCLIYMFFVSNPKSVVKESPNEINTSMGSEMVVPWFRSVTLWLTIMIVCYAGIYFLLW
jgi:SSS family solute:Na+ symporter